MVVAVATQVYLDRLEPLVQLLLAFPLVLERHVQVAVDHAAVVAGEVLVGALTLEVLLERRQELALLERLHLKRQKQWRNRSG